MTKRKPRKKSCAEPDKPAVMTLTEMIISVLREKVALLSETAEGDGRLLAVNQFLLAAFLEAEAERSPPPPEHLH